MLRIVADTNIYISAIFFGGEPEEIIKLAQKKKIELLISGAILTEIGEILKRKFNRPDWQISETIQNIRAITTFVVPKQTLEIITEHDLDNRILECAVERRADYIVSGDEHHLLPLKKFREIKILNPGEFLKIFKQRWVI